MDNINLVSGRLAKLVLCLLVAAIFYMSYYANSTASGLQSTTRISINAQGEEGNWHSSDPDITADGRFVAFRSIANNLVPDDTNFAADVFVVDRQTGEIGRASVSTEGEQGNGYTYYWPSISDDGRMVAFVSEANNLVPEDTNGVWDVFVRDRLKGTTIRVSVSSTGEEANNDSGSPEMGADGRYVVFDSTADNLIAGGVLGEQVYRYDLQTGTTILVSATPTGAQANGISRQPAVSADGRYVAFSSWADNLVAEDNNQNEDVFVKDLLTGAVERVSLNYLGEENNGTDWFPKISATGRYVAFVSHATDMALGDPGGSKVYMYDRETDTLDRISINLAGQQGNEESYLRDISPDGRFVLFVSASSNLVPDDTNQVGDVFVRDRRYSWTYRVSLADDGGEGNELSGQAALSADGQLIAFRSRATNLVPGDTNESDDIFLRIQVQHGQFLPAIYAP